MVVAERDLPAKSCAGFKDVREDFISNDLYLSTFRWVAKRLGIEDAKPPKITYSPVPVAIGACRNMDYEGLYKSAPAPEMIVYSGSARSLGEIMKTVAHESAHACLSTPNTASSQVRHAEEGVARVIGCTAYAAFTNACDENAFVANMLIDASLSIIQSSLVELSMVKGKGDIRPGVLVKLPTIANTLESVDYIIGLAVEIGEDLTKDPVAYSMEKLAERIRHDMLRKGREGPEAGKAVGYNNEVKELFDRSNSALESIGISLAHIRGEDVFAGLERADDFMHYIWSYLGKE